MTFLFAFRPFPLLEKKKIKKNMSFLSRQMYFQDTLLLPGQAATKARADPAARGNGFQLSESNREQEISNKFSASILQTCAKLFLNPH